MSQFGSTNKNPPWVRSAGDIFRATQTVATGVTQQQQQQMQSQIVNQNTIAAMNNPTVMQYQQSQQVFQTPLGLQQASMGMSAINTGVAMPGTISAAQVSMFPQVAAVNYPTPCALNPAAFTNSALATVPPTTPGTAATATPSTKQRVFTGTVTKVHENFGFVDEDVFFQTSCCVKGSNPVVGDLVLVEASFNPNMPFKWNATRIQVLPANAAATSRAQTTSLTKTFSTSASSNTYNAVPPPSENLTSTFSSRSNQRNKQSSAIRRERPKEQSRESEEEEVERKKRREERARDREEKEKRSPSVRHRSKSPRPRLARRSRIVPRYMVQIPRISLDLSEADVLELRRRYTNLYVPSDFFCTRLRWVDAFPPHNPFSLDNPCAFHVMHKEVDPITENSAVLEPSDADYMFSAKVMLMSVPNMEEILRKCCSLAEDKENKDKDDDSRDFVHPTRLINFLVGLRGKNETMAIGGPWSPSLDGDNPDKDPSVLIKTAVRTCRALTGIDLSYCTQWYRFLEIYYRRGETTHKGRVVPARVETVVLFLPDVWSCVPSCLEWDGLRYNYKKQLERKLKADHDTGGTGSKADEKNGEESLEVSKKDPTHHSELDPKVMKVSELRQELEARTLSPKGLKSQLIARLSKALKTEADKEEESGDRKKSEQTAVSRGDPEEREEDRRRKEDDDKRKQEERERVSREKRYALPELPQIIVHPSRTAKSGKFDCTVMSLSLLLDYRPEDTKEHSFEVSLFAELFNEMLMRDFGFRIYRALSKAPDKPKEDEKDRKKDKDKREEKDKDKKDDRDKKEDKDRKDDKKNGRKDDRDDKHSKNKDKSDDKDDDDDDEEFEEEEDDSSKDSKRDKDKRRSKDKDKKKSKPKLYTEHPHLLLAFVYFDQSHCGYIFDKDIEELLYTLGLNLSRAQVRKLVQKVVTRDSLHYRKLTDKPREDSSSDKTKDDKESNNSEDVTELAAGNKSLLPIFKDLCMEQLNLSKYQKSEANETNTVSISEGYVMYKGSLLHVEKLMSQLKRSEKARVNTESKMLSLKEEISEMKDKIAKAVNTSKDLQSTLDDHKAKMRNLEKELSRYKANSDAYYVALQEIQEKISPLLTEEDIREYKKKAQAERAMREARLLKSAVMTMKKEVQNESRLCKSNLPSTLEDNDVVLMGVTERSKDEKDIKIERAARQRSKSRDESVTNNVIKKEHENMDVIIVKEDQSDGDEKESYDVITLENGKEIITSVNEKESVIKKENINVTAVTNEKENKVNEQEINDVIITVNEQNSDILITENVKEGDILESVDIVPDDIETENDTGKIETNVITDNDLVLEEGIEGDIVKEVEMECD